MKQLSSGSELTPLCCSCLPFTSLPPSLLLPSPASPLPLSPPPSLSFFSSYGPGFSINGSRHNGPGPLTLTVVGPDYPLASLPPSLLPTVVQVLQCTNSSGTKSSGSLGIAWQRGLSGESLP